jgi:hypothetical protein
MIEDMTIRKLAPKTQASYIRAVRDFSIFLGCPPVAHVVLCLVACLIAPTTERNPVA